MDGFQSPERRSLKLWKRIGGETICTGRTAGYPGECFSGQRKGAFPVPIQGENETGDLDRGSFWQLPAMVRINVIFNYAQEIFTSAGYTISDMFFNIIVTGSANLIFTVIAIFTVDKLGRRALMRFGALSLTLIYLVMGCCYFFEIQRLPVGITARRPGPLPVTPYRWEP